MITVVTLSDGLASLSSGVLSANIVSASTISATDFFGDGSSLTNLPLAFAITSQNTTIEIDTTTPGTPEHIHVFVDSVDRMFISSVGVGIGVSFPQIALDVSGDISVSGNIIASGNLSGTLLTAVQPNITSLGTLTTVTVSSADINGGNINATLIGATSATTGTFTDLVASDGLNVGFSGTPVSGLLQVGNPAFKFSYNSANPTMEFDVNDYIQYNNGADYMRFVLNNADAIRILGDGKVGIGTNTPSTKLEVSGKVLATSMESTGGVTATTFYGDGSQLTGIDSAGVQVGNTGALFDEIYMSRDADNNLYGNQANTHVNLGFSSDTGTSGQNISYASIGGGFSNTASNNSATVGGGNYNKANGGYATIGGGWGNFASSSYAAVGGGRDNLALHSNSFVGGGFNNTASGSHAAVGGGADNTASAFYATIAGGRENEAAGLNSSVVGGRNLKLTGQGSMGFRGGDNSSQITRSASDTVFFMETALCVGATSTDCNESSYLSGTVVASTAKVTTLEFDDGTTQTTATTASSSKSSAFRVYKTSTQSIPNTDVKTITWEAEDFDLGNDFELANNRFIAPVNGVYHFDAVSHWASGTAAGKFQLQLKINNGLEYDIHCSAPASVQVCSLSALLKLDSGDPVTVDVYQTTGSSRDLNSAKHNTYFTGHLVQETN
jgi:hypothetical protein